MEDNNEELADNDAEEQCAPQLSATELRVLGALMEKQLTTPDAYPLTVNSLITACNQKSSRDPITSLQQGEVLRTLQELQDKNFVRKEFGSRADKYSQQFIKSLELGKKHQALLCVMALRGPQTLSELATRTQRMYEFTKEELEHCIERLCNREVPFVVRLEQQSGQRGERFGHLFSGMPSAAATQTPSSSTAGEAVSRTPAQSEDVQLLEMEVASLNETVDRLQNDLNSLQKQLQKLYQLTGNGSI